jgi:hypothetical protein
MGSTQISYSNKTPIIIGWQGGDSHYGDLYEVMPTLEAVKKKYGIMVEFHFHGAAFHKLYSRVNGRFFSWTEPDVFYQSFRRNLPDIGIIPLRTDKFNEGKSPIKYYEYSYYGIPTVAANKFPYSLAIKSNAGKLYNSQQDLFKYLCNFIEDKYMRKRHGLEARRRVINDCSIEYNSGLWLDTYINCLQRKTECYNKSKIILPHT